MWVPRLVSPSVCSSISPLVADAAFCYPGWSLIFQFLAGPTVSHLCLVTDPLVGLSRGQSVGRGQSVHWLFGHLIV